MKQCKKNTLPDITAVKTALWRAIHVQVDAKPHVFEDEIGMKLICPETNWQKGYDTKFSKRFRASIVARARYIEELIIDQVKYGISQYVILGAGLDTFAQRRPEIACQLQIYEVDQSDTLNWKRRRLNDLNFGMPDYLHFVPADFETSSWTEQLIKSGFDISKPAVVVCTGLTIYLTVEAIATMLKQISAFAHCTTIAITVYLPFEMLDEKDQLLRLGSMTAAQKAGNAFISFFTPKEIVDLARGAGLKQARTVSLSELSYFNDRSDGLQPASGEVFLLAAT